MMCRTRISKSPWINLPVFRGTSYCTPWSLSLYLWPGRFNHRCDLCVSVQPSLDYCPSHSHFLPSLIVPLSICLVLSPPSFFFLDRRPPPVSDSPRVARSPFILTPPSPPFLCTGLIRQTQESNAQTPCLTSPMSTLLSSCPHSRFLSGSVSAWIPSLMGPHHFRQLQFLSVDKQRCGAALQTAQRDCRLMPQSDLHINKSIFWDISACRMPRPHDPCMLCNIYIYI